MPQFFIEMLSDKPVIIRVFTLNLESIKTVAVNVVLRGILQVAYHPIQAIIRISRYTARTYASLFKCFAYILNEALF